ncbi:MAG: DUF998 domain-containing protein [Methanomassiliicoccaceae archaeon]|jgi:hypothetical membrane protein|nr:DUF998 domain-containing protein [Methanomassiliicoccaceae archaeon]
MELVNERNILIGLAASLAVLAFGLSWYIAALSDPEWIFGANYLSDLGVSNAEMSRIFFNGGCIVAGILLTIAGTAMITCKKGKLHKGAGICAVISGIAMALVGIVTEDAGDPHIYVAVIAFGMGFLALILLAIRDRKNGLKALSSLTLLGIFLVALSYLWLIYFETDVYFLSDAPGVETVMALVLFVLFLLQGMKFLYHGGMETEVHGKGMCDRHKTAIGFVAVSASVAFIIFWGFAMLSDPGWLFGTDPVYELGFSKAGEAEMFFVMACVVGGLFTLLYGIGAGMMHNGQARSVGGFFHVLMGATLYLLGLTYLLNPGLIGEHIEHCLVAMGALAILCIVISDWLNKHMATAAFYLFILSVSVLAMLYYDYESASAISIAVFFTIIGIEGTKLILSK